MYITHSILMGGSWNVRNVGLILFSSLTLRSLASERGTQDFYRSREMLATRQPFHIWHTKYPSVLPFVVTFLQDSAANRSDKIRGTNHSALFPILVILRSLRWSEQGTAIQDALTSAIVPYLNSTEWQVRRLVNNLIRADTL